LITNLSRKYNNSIYIVQWAIGVIIQLNDIIKINIIINISFLRPNLSENTQQIKINNQIIQKDKLLCEVSNT